MQAISYRLLTFFAVTFLITFTVDAQTPSISSSNSDTLVYQEGDAGKLIDETIESISSANNSRFDGGHVRFLSNYVQGEDSLYIEGSNPPVDYTWNDASGTMTFSQKANELDYQTAFRAVRYFNKSDNPDTSIREVEYSVTDRNGIGTLSKKIQVIAVNDPPWFYLDNTSNQRDTLSYATANGRSIEICPNVFDAEGDDFELLIVNIVNESGQAVLSDNAKCVIYTPESDFIGDEYIEVRLQDTDEEGITRDAVIKVLVSDAPSLDNVSETLSYQENDGNVLINPNLTVLYSGDQLTKATVQISDAYLSSEDSLIYTGDDVSIAKAWDDDNGKLELSGTAAKELYREVLRQVAYQNKSENPSETDRVVSFQVEENTLISSTISTVISVAATNDAPYVYSSNNLEAADTISFSVAEDEMLSICPTVFDVEGDDFVASISSADDFSSTIILNENCVDFTPPTNSTQIQYFIYEVADVANQARSTKTVVEVVITPVNDAPVIVNNGVSADTVYFGIDLNQSIEICLETEDPEGDQVSISSIPGPYNFGDVSNINGLCFDYSANQDAVGDEFLQVIVCDDAVNSLCDTATVFIQIPGTNSAPEFTISESDTIERATLVSEIFNENFQLFNRERDQLTIDTAYLGTQSGQLEVEIDEGVSVTYVPEKLDSLIENTIFLKVCDDRVPSLCDSLAIDLTINYTPSLIIGESQHVDSLEFAMLQDTNLDTCFSLFDINNHTMFFSSLRSDGNGILDVNVDSQTNEICLSYTPESGFVGAEEFTVAVCDNGEPEGCSDIQIVYAVYETNTAPSFIYEGDSSINQVAVDLLENDSVSAEISIFDLQGDQFCIDTLLDVPEGLIFALSDSSLNFEFIPPVNSWGTYTSTIILCDDNQFPLCRELDLMIDVEPTNESPIINPDTVEIFTSEMIKVAVLTNDRDTENEGLFIDELIDQSQVLGSVTLSDSTIIYDPDPDEYRDVDVITYSVCDRGVPQACVSSALTIIFSLPIPDLEIYEAFSPNGDGVNDTWFLDGIREFPANKVTVLDQYNNLIFQASGYDNRSQVWSGELAAPGGSELVADGTYYYVIDLGEGMEVLKGYVVLKR